MAEVPVLPFRPTVVCLVGSTRFKEAYERAARDETLAGRIVLSVGMFGHQEGIDMDGPIKAMLDELHLRKIDLAQEILVVNPKTYVCGVCHKPCEHAHHGRTDCCNDPNWIFTSYVGDSTKREIAYAESCGKAIRYLEPME